MTNALRSPPKRLAVLIDAENARAQVIKPLLDEVAEFGDAKVKRAYGDWTSAILNPWKDSLKRFAIQPVQQFPNTAGKNASDISLIIDAMDLLHSGRFDGFCIVSSDSDFTRLACRLRESGIAVYGCGKKQTPEPFVSACDRFSYEENLVTSSDGATASPATVGIQPGPTAKKALPLGPAQVKIIRAALEALAPAGGWTPLDKLANQFPKLSPRFVWRAFGYSKLPKLLGTSDEFRVELRAADGKEGSKHWCVALNPKR